MLPHGRETRAGAERRVKVPSSPRNGSKKVLVSRGGGVVVMLRVPVYDVLMYRVRPVSAAMKAPLMHLDAMDRDRKRSSLGGQNGYHWKG